MSDTTDDALPGDAEVAIVGAGFSGLAVADRLRRAGVDDLVVLERAGDIGGTWRDNAYPGCACDVPSHLYSFSFAPNPRWSSTFSAQPEIQQYLQDVARTRGLLPVVRLRTELEEARWDRDAQRWRLRTSAGPLTARILVAAAGPLSEPAVPRLPGLDRFRGTMFHSARWDHTHRLDDERVAVVGTGASAIQFVPRIQPRVERLHLFQRTPPWVMPRRTRRLTPAEHALYGRLPAAQRAMREAIYYGRELYALPLLRRRLAPLARGIARTHLRLQVRDERLRARLTPDYLPGCKRILISNDYLPSLQQPNVEVISSGVREVGERTVTGDDGTQREVDTIIFATGFCVTDMPIARRLRGADGRSLDEAWQGSPRAHRGTTVSGFPNLFLVLGPNTGLGHTSVVVMAEAQAEYIAQALLTMRRCGAASVDVTPAAQAAWNAAVEHRMRGTVWTEGGCSSWYLDRTGRNSTLWPGFTVRYRRLLRRFDAESYTMRPCAPEPVARSLAAAAA